MDLLDLLRELHAKGVDLFLHQQGLDTSTPSGRAMFQMMGVFAEFERAMIRERVVAGLVRAKEQGTTLGRRTLERSDAAKVSAIRTALAQGRGVRGIAKELRTGVGTVLRIKGEQGAPPSAKASTDENRTTYLHSLALQYLTQWANSGCSVLGAPERKATTKPSVRR
jgi:DNA invertase Pin-like site-specific DNA recombinase